MFHYLVHFKLDINFNIVMFIWWQRIWSTDLLRTHHHYQHEQQQHQHQQQNQQISITNVRTKRQSSHIVVNRRRRRQSPPPPTHTSHQMPYSIHNCSNTRQSKCIRMSSTEQSSRMKSFCSVIILIHCFNVFVLAIASENSTATQPQPCDRTRRVYTDVQGEISNGPFGSNYTQVSRRVLLFVSVFFSISFHSIHTAVHIFYNFFLFVVTLSGVCEVCVFLVELISNSIVIKHFVHFFITKERWMNKRSDSKMNKRTTKCVVRLNHAN